MNKMSGLEFIVKKCCVCSKINFRGKYESLKIIPESSVLYTHTYCPKCYDIELKELNKIK